MSNLLKRSAIYLLLVLFLFNTTGYSFLYEILKARVKREMKARIEKGGNPLVILQLNATGEGTEFQRIEQKEIRYHGRMYDVIREVRSGGIIIFYCIHDKKEENLIATMKSLGGNKMLQFLWEHVIKIAVPQFNPPSPLIASSDITYPTLLLSICSSILYPESPPPKTS